MNPTHVMVGYYDYDSGEFVGRPMPLEDFAKLFVWGEKEPTEPGVAFIREQPLRVREEP
jgi:hypothetical protein